MSRQRSNSCLCVVSILGWLVCMPAVADETIEEIVVTAQRQSEKAQDVPIAITALSGNDLESRGVRNAGDVVASVPNLVFTAPYGEEAQPTFALRGVTTSDYSQNQSSPIAMYVDEVYKSVGALQTLQVYDLDRVEVLRGPQGTLYGKNATGGAVSFFSRNPSLTSSDGYITVGAGNYSDFTVQGAFGGPLIENKLGLRAAVYYDKRDGWMDSIVPGVRPSNGVDARAARLTLLARPFESLTAQLKLSVSRSGGTPFGPRPFNVDASVTGYEPQIGWFQNATMYSVNKKIDNDSVSLKIDWQIGDHYTLTSVSGYDFGRWYEPADDGSVGVQIFGIDTYQSTVNAASEELRLSSHGAGNLSWLAGMYLDRSSVNPSLQYHYFDAYPGVFVSGATTLYGFDQFNSFNQVKTSQAAYLNLNYRLTPAVTLRGGLRYTRDKVSIHDFYALEGGLPGPPAGPQVNIPTLWTPTIPYLDGVSFVDFAPGTAPQAGTYPTLANSTSNVSFKAGVDWKHSDDVMTYLSISRGFRGVAFNGQALNDPLELTFAKPEQLTSYELGNKAQFLEHRLQVNTAAFYYDYRNQQFLDQFAGPTGPLYHVINAPKSRIAGAEAEVRVKASDALELRANLGYLDGTYKELTLRGVDQSGHQIANAPKVSASLAFDWRALDTGAGILRLQADGNYYSTIYFDAYNTRRIAQSSYVVANARTAFEFGASRQYQVAAWIKNLANTKYLAYALALRNPEDGGLGLDFGIVGEPRTLGITASMKF